MSYSFAHSLALGTSKAGILSQLRAQLFNLSGINVGSPISSGFVEIGNGNYLWYYTGFPDGFRGGVKFYSSLDLATVLASIAINPEEGENVDEKLSDLESRIMVEIERLIARNNVSINVSNEANTSGVSPGVSGNEEQIDVTLGVTQNNDSVDDFSTGVD